jgi:multicomponent Na+:H+ antiporter subunit E
VALTERLSLLNAAAGLAIAVTALALTRRLCPGLLDTLNFSVYYFAFIGYLIGQIFKSAVRSFGYVFSKDVRVSLVKYPTALKRDSLQAMLANAISLTPGTVTADIRDDTLEVMMLVRNGQEEDTRSFERMERILKHLDRRDTV